MGSSSNTVKTLLIAVAVLTAGNVGLFSGMLRRMDGDSIPGAIQVGCGAFAGTIAVVFTVIGFWYGFQNREP